MRTQRSSYKSRRETYYRCLNAINCTLSPNQINGKSEKQGEGALFSGTFKGSTHNIIRKTFFVRIEKCLVQHGINKQKIDREPDTIHWQ